MKRNEYTGTERPEDMIYGCKTPCATCTAPIRCNLLFFAWLTSKLSTICCYNAMEMCVFSSKELSLTYMKLNIYIETVVCCCREYHSFLYVTSPICKQSNMLWNDKTTCKELYNIH